MPRLLLCVALALSLGLPARSSAQSLGPPITTWTPNGSVKALALDGHTLYVGGEFDIVGPATGSFGAVDVNDATAITTGAAVSESTAAIAADGAGGWFVATDTLFSPIVSVLHVQADGTRDPGWTPPVFDRGPLAGLVVDGGRLFVGGGFLTVNGSSRPGLVALDPSSGATAPWDPRLVGIASPPQAPFPPAVFELAASSGRVYVHGLFESAGGAPRSRFAVLDASSGDALPGVLDPPAGSLSTIVATPTRVYLYGDCRLPGLVVCAYSPDMVPLAGWTFPLSLGPLAVGSGALFSVQVSPVGPPFGATVVALDPDTGVELPFASPVMFGYPGTQVHALTVSGNAVYVGGNLTTANGQPRARLAAFDVTTGALLPWAPLVGGEVRALATSGNAVAFGGWFQVAGGLLKRGIVALDLRTGRPGVATPDLAFNVKTLLRLGGVMVAGGERPSGQAGPDLTAFLTSSGTPLPWALTSNGSVDALATDGRQLYIGGRFSSLSGALRLNLASVDLATAGLTFWNPQPNGQVYTLVVNGNTLFAGGAFNALTGYGRSKAAAFDTTTGGVLSFNPSVSTTSMPRGFGFAPGRVLVASEDYAQPYGATPLTWLDRVSGAPVAPLGVSFRSGAAAQFDGTVYLLGNTATGTNALLGVDTTTGRTRAWPVAVDSLTSASTAVAVSADYVALSSGLAYLVSSQNFAVYAAPRAGAPQQMQAAVAGDTVTLGWQPGAGPASTAFLVEAGTAPGGTDVGVFNVGLSTRVTGTLAPGTYYIRVRGLGASGAGAASSEVIATVPPIPTAPAAPGTLTASVSDAVVTLSWGAAAGNATSYVIEAGTAAGLSNIGALPTGNLDTSWSVPAPPGTYFVRVRSANAFGLSPATNEVTVVVP